MTDAASRTAWIALAIVMGIQLWNGTHRMPPAAVFSGEPFYADDYILHFARAEAVAAELPETGRLWVYEVGHMAGYPLGAAVFDLDNQGMAVLFALLPFADPAVVFNLVAFLCYALAPLAIALATRALGLSPTAAVAAAAASLFVSNVTRNFEFGMFAGFAASYLAVLVVVLAHRHLEAPSPARFAALVTVGGLGVFFHAFVGLLVLVPCTVLVLAHARAHPARTIGQAAAVLASVLVLNAIWVGPYLSFAGELGWDYPHPFFRTGPLWWAYQNFVLAFAGWHVFVAALGLAGFASWARGGSPPFRLAWACWVLLLGVICVRGSEIPLLQRIEPANMVLPLEFALCPFAGHAAAQLARRVAGRFRLPAASLPALAPLLFAPYLVWLVLFVGERTPLSTRLPQETREFAEWLERHTDRSGRIMIEDRRHHERPPIEADVPMHPYADGHFLAALPDRIDRELIGGPYAEAPIAPHQADFASGRAFGRLLGRWPPRALARRLELYGVGWIVAWSPPSIEYLSAHPALAEPVDRFGPFQLFRTRAPAGFFERGEGRVDARRNAIRVSDATPGGVILRYHWYAGMCSDPPLPVRPAPIPGAAMPFIAVDNGAVRDFVVRPVRGWLGGC